MLSAPAAAGTWSLPDPSFSRSALAAARSCSKCTTCPPAPQEPSGTSRISTHTRIPASEPPARRIEDELGGLLDQTCLAPLAESPVRDAHVNDRMRLRNPIGGSGWVGGQLVHVHPGDRAKELGV